MDKACQGEGGRGAALERKISLMEVMLSKDLNEAREEAMQVCGKVFYRLRAQQVQDQKEQTGNRRCMNKSLADGGA